MLGYGITVCFTLEETAKMSPKVVTFLIPTSKGTSSSWSTFLLTFGV